MTLIHQRRPVLRIATVLAVAVAAVLAAVTLPAPASAVAGTTRTSSGAQTGNAVLVDIRAASHPRFDRVVFEFAVRAPRVSVTWVDELTGIGSGLPIPVAGRAILQVRMSGTDAHVNGTPTVPVRTAYAMKNVITTVSAGDFEGEVVYGIGVLAPTPFRTMRLVHPNRLVIDLSTACLQTVTRSVMFVDTNKVLANVDPPVTAVRRQVLARTPATGVMDRLYAGPTPAETARGLTFVASESTGFARLRISNQIARVQLTGGCSSGGSAVATVATQIFPTLKQFGSVDWVKIYDPAGHTETPWGRSDSIPECLEP